MAQAKQAHALSRNSAAFKIARDHRNAEYYWSELQRVTDPRRAADLMRCWALAWVLDHRAHECRDEIDGVLFAANCNAKTVTIAASSRSDLRFYLEHWGYLRPMPQSCGEWLR